MSQNAEERKINVCMLIVVKMITFLNSTNILYMEQNIEFDMVMNLLTFSFQTKVIHKNLN